MLFPFYLEIETLKEEFHLILKQTIWHHPPLVVAYAIAGHMEVDLYKDALGKDKNGKDVFLKDIWPSNKEIEDTLKQSLNAEMFIQRYSNVSEGPNSMAKN